MNILTEYVVRVAPKEDGWHVRPNGGKETTHNRKAVAALRAKQLAINSPDNGRVVFYRFDGTIELERIYNQKLKL